jgi:hypothetical protein
MRKLLAAAVVAVAIVTCVEAVGSYSTAFPLTENPISEGGVWTNGKAVGVDWSDVRTTPGLAFGTQTGVGGFDDSIAVLQGTWSPDQSATATVHTVNQQSGGVFEEVELLLRFAITAHGARGYEVNFRCAHDGTQYAQVVRWNGALAGFTLLDSRPGPGLADGDRVTATIVGSTITSYINDVPIFSVTDAAFTDGNPGMGFYLQGASGLNADYGFTSFTATGGSVPSTAPGQTGRMTGEGTIVTPSGLVMDEFELQCNASDAPNRLEVKWGGNRFRLEGLTSAICVDDPSIGSANPPDAAFDTYKGQGIGTYNGAPGASAEWTITDAGEPGKNDTFTIQIRNSGHLLLLTASGRLITGNNQAHKHPGHGDAHERDEHGNDGEMGKHSRTGRPDK